MTAPRTVLHPHRQGRRVGLVAALFALVLTGCTADPAAPATGGAPAGGQVPADQPKVDACNLLTPAEVTELIGGNSSRPQGGGVDDFGCGWENPDTAHSITVGIGAPGTAANGELPAESAYGETEPGPDGIRFAPGNVAEFVIDDRACEIQVVTSVTDNTDRATAIRLIQLIRERI